MELRGKKINFLGDSITQGVGTTCIEKRFTDILARKYGAICRNYGISGTRIAKSEDSKENNFCTRVETMSDDADMVIVFGGTNDFGTEFPLGTMSDRIQSTFYGALHVLLTSLINKYIASRIIIITPLHRSDCEKNHIGERNIRTANNLTLRNYIEVIREVAEYYSLPLLDLYATSGLQPEIDIIKRLYVPDGLHPNDAGHEILADKISAFLQTI